jgi:nicotinate-nucleotide--dimethylbenzimidazole phosphoribosyltransferase
LCLAATTSPCRKQCQLDHAHQCSGCGRTIDEISGWNAMTADERAAVNRRLDDARSARIRRALDDKTKPQGSLGQLERLAFRIAMVQRTEQPSIDRARVLIFAGDHGVAAQGVSAYPASVTAAMVRTAAAGGAAVSVLTRAVAGAWADVEIIDVGVASPLPDLPGVIAERVANGTRDFLHEPAMTGAECAAAACAGAQAVRRAVAAGAQVIALGEMGIANTTSAAAVLSALSGLLAEQTVGRGTGIDDQTLRHKQGVVTASLRRHQAQMMTTDGAPDPWAVLACVGGFELAALAGAAIAAADARAIVLVDGFITTAAVLAAAMIDVRVLDVIVFAHRSAEQGHANAMDQFIALGLPAEYAQPLLQLDLRLGEGSGAALALPLLRAAACMLSEMATFDSANVARATDMA